MDNPENSVAVPKTWTLWTVWSSQLGQLMDSNQLSTTEFASEVMAVIEEKDDDFCRKAEDDIKVVRPTKVLDVKTDPETNAVRVEIGACYFKPGTRRDEGGLGKRWRLIASNQLAVVFNSDKKFKPVKLANEIFVVINGRVFESARQIRIDDYDQETKIIRLIDEQIRPGTDNRYMQVSHKFRNTWKRKGTSEHAVLQIRPYQIEPPNNANVTLECPLRSPSMVIPSNSPVLHGSPRRTPRRSFRSVQCKSSDNEVNGNDGGNQRESALVEDFSGASGDGGNDSDSGERKKFKQKFPRLKRPRSPAVKTYTKLQDLEDKLQKQLADGKNVCILQHRNAYGIVDEIITKPIKKFASPNRSESFIIRISDETKTNVMVRLCTSINPVNKVGPTMEVGDIIRIHRATAQFETNVDGSRELVVSTFSHLNYCVFNNSQDVGATISYKRLAKHTEAVKDVDIGMIKQMRTFSKSRKNTQYSSSDLGDIFEDSQLQLSDDNNQDNEGNPGISQEENVISQENSSSKLYDVMEADSFGSDSDRAVTQESVEIPKKRTKLEANENNASDPPHENGSNDIVLPISQLRIDHGNKLKIIDYLEDVTEDKIIVRVSGDSIPLDLDSATLIENENEPVICEGAFVDIAIEHISKCTQLRSILLNTVGSSCCIIPVQKIIVRHESDDDGNTRRLLTLDAGEVLLS